MNLTVPNSVNYEPLLELAHSDPELLEVIADVLVLLEAPLSRRHDAKKGMGVIRYLTRPTVGETLQQV